MIRPTWRMVALVMALMGGAAGTVGAQQPETLRITASNVTAEEADRAERAVVLPGDVVLYRLTFTNGESAAVRNIVLANPIPEGLEYVAGSAGADMAGVEIEFSIDGGVTFSARPLVERVVDGRTERVPAEPELYTDVRWRLREWVQPGGQVQAEYRARVSGPRAER